MTSKVRAKFRCTEVGTQRYSVTTDPLHTAKFEPVTSGSEENKEFFRYTPSGSVTLAVLKNQYFEPGKEYYLDFTEAS